MANVIIVFFILVSIDRETISDNSTWQYCSKDYLTIFPPELKIELVVLWFVLSWRTAMKLLALSNVVRFSFLIFTLLQFQSCSLIEKTRRHFLGDTRPKSSQPSDIQQKVHAPEQESPVQIGNADNNTVSVDSPAAAPATTPASAPVSSALELADPNSLWIFDTHVHGGGAGKDLDTLQKALQLYSSKQWDASMGQLRTIVQSSNDQVQVRARFYAGKILQYKQKHSLALQVFEQIIEQNGYSSLSMLALKEAVASSKEAQIKDKELFYQTSLDDLIKQGQIP